MTMKHGYQPTGDQVVDPKPPSGGSAILTSGDRMVKPIIPPKAQAALRVVETLGPILAAERGIGVTRSEPSGEMLAYATALLTVRSYLESSGPDFSSDMNVGIENADGSPGEQTDAEFLDSLRERRIPFRINTEEVPGRFLVDVKVGSFKHRSNNANLAEAVEWLRKLMMKVAPLPASV